MRGSAPARDATEFDEAGADLLTETPEILERVADFDGPLVVGNYAYADGAAFVRVAMAADMLTTEFLARRLDVAIAYLATPTDVFAVPPAAVRQR